MEKNKSAHKLKNIGPIYYINLDGQPERKEYMENLFKHIGILKTMKEYLHMMVVVMI